MNSSLKQAAALAVCLCFICQQSTQAQLFSRTQSSQKKTPAAKQKTVLKKDSSVQQAIAAMQTSKKQQSAATTASYNTFEALPADGAPYYDMGGSDMEGSGCSTCKTCFDGCCGGQCSQGKGIFQRPGEFFFVGEYIYARPSFSEALAYLVSDSNEPLQGLQVVEFDFDYQSSYRFGGGYRFCDCGGEIAFNFARYRGESNFAVQDTSSSVSTTIFGPYEVNAPGDDGFLFGDADVDVKSYDLGVSKTIPLGSPLGCGKSCCDSGCDDACCGDCCCGWCPAWDITWSAGVRFVDADWSRNLNSFDNELEPVRTSTVHLDFEGVGARIGLLGRRYFGQSGCVSMYAKGDLSLLVGEMDIFATFTDIAGQGLTTLVHSNTGRRVIPVTEIEAGLTAHLGKHVNLSSGYFISAWHDLGFRDEYNFGGNFQLLMYDDANILGFDGYFARAEVTY
jgi:hypothetical protein